MSGMREGNGDRLRHSGTCSGRQIHHPSAVMSQRHIIPTMQHSRASSKLVVSPMIQRPVQGATLSVALNFNNIMHTLITVRTLTMAVCT